MSRKEIMKQIKPLVHPKVRAKLQYQQVHLLIFEGITQTQLSCDAIYNKA